MKDYYAIYDQFTLSDAADNYRLHISNYSGTAGDSLINPHNNNQFSTKDARNDAGKYDCAKRHRGAWWYTDCDNSNLNGKWATNGNRGMTWQTLNTDGDKSMAFTEMKVKLG